MVIYNDINLEELSHWLTAARTEDTQLRGYRIGQHNGVYGPLLPLSMQMERALARLERLNSLPPETIIVHPAIYQEWVDAGWITADGQWKYSND